MLDQKESTIPSKCPFQEDVLEGLRKEHKSIPCKYFYDERGSKLFEQICELDEYYLTNCELEIMQKHAQEIASVLPRNSVLVEFGSGSSIKTRYLLDAIDHPLIYIPVDVSGAHLRESVAALEANYPHIQIEPVVGDFTQPIPFPECVRPDANRTVYFPGSTIGNFAPDAAARLMQVIANEIGNHGGLILGIDLQKDPQVIEAAYNDREGVTSEFNLNLLNRINWELNGDFDLGQFEHRSVYNEELGRIETHIVSKQQQTVSVAGEKIEFKENEEIHTEYSYKYKIDEFKSFAAQFGLNLENCWMDDRKYFAVLHLVREKPGP